MFTIYTSCFNVIRMGFNWRDTLRNWHSFLGDEGQICIAINKSDDETLDLVKKFIQELRGEQAQSRVRFDIVETDFSWQEDREFHGKIKSAALQLAKEPFCIALDLDEVLPLYTKEAWMAAAFKLDQSNLDGYFIPVFDLCQSWDKYKKLGQKLYLHKNKPDFQIGIIPSARREDGTIDMEKTSTSELISQFGKLAVAEPLLSPTFPDFVRIYALQEGKLPFVFHLGWMEFEQKLRQITFWEPILSHQAGKEIVQEIKTLEKYMAIPTFAHNLRHWNQG